MKFHPIAITALTSIVCLGMVRADDLPFQHKVEVYRDKDGDALAFTVRLEQPFLAEEFEQSSYLRLRSDNQQAYLIYPKEAKFEQKHAEFYGRLRGAGAVELTLTYETVSENLDGTRRVEKRSGKINVPIPTEETGPRSIFLDWARRQNDHFAELLKYYPDESFYQYCLLQSASRYGIERPQLPAAAAGKPAGKLEVDLYRTFTGSHAIQTPLQSSTLLAGSTIGDLDQHISSVSPPRFRTHDYEELLEQSAQQGRQPQPHEVAKLIPHDQYMLVFNSFATLGDMLDLSTLWGEGVFRLFSQRAQDHRLQEKLEEQLILQRDAMQQLAETGVVGEFTVTGGDLFVLEGTDVSVIFRLAKPEEYDKAFVGWLADLRERHPNVARREFNYRGHQIVAYYTTNRMVSSFSVRHEGHQIVSNSHRAIRRILDAVTGDTASLNDQLDYQYVTTLLPPEQEADNGYFFASEAFLQRQVGPQAKISEKRRLQCFNNLVMLNNASLFYRLEYGESPETLSDLVEGRFIDLQKVVCPHGGAYAFDAEHDSCTCSLHNRLRYLTPNQELQVLKVAQREVQEYESYKGRYAGFWQKLYNPLAIRIDAAPHVKLEMCVLPQRNGTAYRDFRQMVDKQPREFDTARIAPSAIMSMVLATGREKAGGWLTAIPGIREALRADPTLTDLSWIGDRIGLHYCDGESVLQIDPADLQQKLPMIGQVPVVQQIMGSSVVLATGMPVYGTIEVENREKAERLLELMSKEVFLQGGGTGLVPLKLDGYRLPDYQGHAVYVFSIQAYAIKLRLHVALVGNQLVAATKPSVLEEVIDASTVDAEPATSSGHLLVRFNRLALEKMYDDVQIYWAEKSRLACHRNTILMYNLHNLYGTPIEDVPELAEVKYGIRPYCPDHGEYSFDSQTNQCVCSVHGNRELSRQKPRVDQASSFSEFIDTLREVNLVMRYEEDAMIVTAEVIRAGE
jgi:hypothetical protein